MARPNWKYLKVYKYYRIDPSSGWEEREPSTDHIFFSSLEELARSYGKHKDEEYYQIGISGLINDISDIVSFIKKSKQ